MNFFVTKIVEDSDVTYNLTVAGYVALAAVMLVVFAAGCMFQDKNKKMDAKQIAFCAMAMALAVVTSMFKIIDMPMGGSVALFSMLFIVLTGYWFGVRTGITTAVAYGILQLLINPYIISIWQMLMDYVFAFGALGLAGLFSNKKKGLIKGYIAGILGRYFFSFLSGWIFFAVYTPDFFNSAILYSLAYNGAYIGLEAAITLIVLALPPVNEAMQAVKKLVCEA